MDSKLWEELAISQICTALASLVASSTMVAFISSGSGLSNPHRRLTFGLSVSDIFQSFAILTGPWFTAFGSPQAFWACGNETTCELGGFLLSMGISSGHMYSFCLCVYFVCKLKAKMNDTSFAQNIEKTMHFFIIGFNLLMHILALTLGTFNPSPLGNMCYFFAYPAGCMMQYPENFEAECDSKSFSRSVIFSTMNNRAIPLLCLIGTIVCYSDILFNIFERKRGLEQTITATRDEQHSTNDHLQSKCASDTASGKEKNHQSQSGSSNELTQTFAPNYLSITNITNTDGKDDTNNEGDQSHDHDSPLYSLLSADDIDANHVDETNCVPLNECGNDPNSDSATSLQRDVNVVESDRNQGDGENQMSVPPSEQREVAIQAVCHVFVFFLTSLPFLILNAVLLRGSIPTRMLLRANMYLFPLGGVFNILVYIRPNVARLRAKHPEISVGRALWMIIRAGGEEPNVPSGDLARASSNEGEISNGEVSSSLSGLSLPTSINVDLSLLSQISDLRHGIYHEPSHNSSSPDSNQALMAQSSSLDSESQLSSRSNKRWESFRPIDSTRAYNTSHNEMTNHGGDKEMDDVWEEAFQRARNMKYQ